MYLNTRLLHLVALPLLSTLNSASILASYEHAPEQLQEAASIALFTYLTQSPDQLYTQSYRFIAPNEPQLIAACLPAVDYLSSLGVECTVVAPTQLTEFNQYPHIQFTAPPVSSAYPAVSLLALPTLLAAAGHELGNTEGTVCQPDTHAGIVTAQIATGELIDKITILDIKAACITDPQKLANVLTEREALYHTRNRCIEPSPELDALTYDLYQTNKQMWDIEDAIREKEHKQEFDDEFIALARSIYYTNDHRCAIKRAINLMTGSRIIEEKSYTEYTPAAE